MKKELINSLYVFAGLLAITAIIYFAGGNSEFTAAFPIGGIVTISSGLTVSAIKLYMKGRPSREHLMPYFLWLTLTLIAGVILQQTGVLAQSTNLSPHSGLWGTVALVAVLTALNLPKALRREYRPYWNPLVVICAVLSFLMLIIMLSFTLLEQFTYLNVVKLAIPSFLLLLCLAWGSSTTIRHAEKTFEIFKD